MGGCEPFEMGKYQTSFNCIKKIKTEVPLEVPWHEIALHLLGERKEGPVFHLPTQDGSNKFLCKWTEVAGIKKHITRHCARHSFSVLLQQNGIDLATVAGMLGHTSIKYV